MAIPIEIACVIVWRVVDTAKAMFDVQDYGVFVHIQCETALRHLASHYPYEPHETGEVSLRGSPEKVGETLQREVQGRVELAGIEIIEAQLSHLAYSPEIAQAMLRRQQAAAVIGARQMIVEGAVSMVEMALKKLEADNVVHLDEKSKSVMVNNLMIALVSESHIQPVMATSTQLNEEKFKKTLQYPLAGGRFWVYKSPMKSFLLMTVAAAGGAFQFLQHDDRPRP